MKWDVVYKRAINDDGSLFFPEKLTHEFLAQAKRTMGSYVFANQYLNEIIPSDMQTFKNEWFRYYDNVPSNVNNFIFIDPALSEADGADYTGIVVVSVDFEKHWYVRHAGRYKLTPTRLIEKIFELHKMYNPNVIGVEEVAYQKALLYFLDEEMRRRKTVLPVMGVKPPTDKTKHMRILSLVPRFEWSRVFLARNLQDLELELLQFPRGSHDDIIDALAGIEFIYYPPAAEKKWAKPPHPSSPDYEKWFIENLRRRNG